MAKMTISAEPSRIEKLSFKMKFNEDQYDQFREAARYFDATAPLDMKHGDKLKITFDVFVHYLGDVAEKLEAIHELQKKGITVETEELEYGDCLIQRVLSAIRKLK